MFNQPFDTTPCAGYQTKEIINGLMRAMAMGELVEAKTINGMSVAGIVTVPSYVKTIPPFFHPIAFDNNGERVIAIDSRACLKQSPDGEDKITSPADYNFLLTRAILMKDWLTEDRNEMLAISDFAARVYMRWLPEVIGRRLSLDPGAQVVLVALAGLFFFSSFGVQIEKTAVAQRISRLTRMPYESVIKVIEPLEDANNVEDFIGWVKQSISSPRVEQFNPGFLYAALGAAWYGPTGRELSAVAVEYPPYLFAMIFTGLQDRSFRNAPLNKIVEQVDRGGAGKQFLMQIASLISELTNNG